MRRIAVLGALALTLTVAAPAFAASHTTNKPSTHPAAASRTLRASETAGKGSLSSRIVLASNGKSGTFWESVKGEAPKSHEASVVNIGACGAKGDTAVVSVARTVGTSGAWSGTTKLTTAEVAKILAALKAGKHLSVAATDGSMRLCGAFSG